MNYEMLPSQLTLLSMSNICFRDIQFKMEDGGGGGAQGKLWKVIKNYCVHDFTCVYIQMLRRDDN